MIFYFTGTGNSRYIAKLIADQAGEPLVSINRYVKSGIAGVFCAEEPLVFVTPTYAWRIPRVARDFILGAAFTGCREAYFVLTCGTDTGNAGYYARKLCKEAGLSYMGLTAIPMPENYLALFTVPPPKKAKAIIRLAGAKARAAAARIAERKPFLESPPGFMGRLKSGPVNCLFYPAVVHARGFYITDACIGCGQCARLCPLSNITMEEGRPRWGSRCTHCMACIAACPKQAVEYKRASIGKERHYLPAPFELEGDDNV